MIRLTDQLDMALAALTAIKLKLTCSLSVILSSLYYWLMLSMLGKKNAADNI